jgi:hypothetical protein
MIPKPNLAAAQVYLFSDKSLEPGLFEDGPAKVQGKEVQAEVSEPDSRETAGCGPRQRYHAVDYEKSRSQNGQVFHQQRRPEDEKRVPEIGLGHLDASPGNIPHPSAR